MKKKLKVLTVILVSILILMACSNQDILQGTSKLISSGNQNTLEGTWQLISDGELEALVNISDSIVSVVKPDREEREKYKLLSSFDEDIHTYSFVDLSNNQTVLRFDGYFEDENTFLTIETSEPNYGFQLLKISKQELEKIEGQINEEKLATELEREEKEKLEREKEIELEKENKEARQNTEIEDTYRMTCAACHGADLSGAAGPSLMNIGNKLTEEDIVEIIKHGKGSMPGNLVAPDEVALLTDWLIKQ